jgi:two-component system, chemotaxis family, response regulator PixG
VNEQITSPTVHLRDFFLQLKRVKTNFFSGSLVVSTHNADSYLVFNFHLGRLNWSGRSFDQFDCWRRHLGTICTQISGVEINALAMVSQPELVSSTLVNLLAKQKINRKQLNDIITVMFEENLFDAIQFAYIANMPLEYKWISGNDQAKNLAQALPLLAIKPHLTSAFEKCQLWQARGLGDFYTNLSIKLVTSAHSDAPDVTLTNRQQKMLPFLTQGYNLRNLANYLRQPLQIVAETLLPLIENQIVVFVLPELQYSPAAVAIGSQSDLSDDLDSSIFTFSTLTTDVSYAATMVDQPLIACIDDSETVYQCLRQLLIPHGYQTMGIQDSIQALPALIRSKPDLIFLDLIMPIANGYEICAQIRRTPALRNTPIIILTGKDGLVDKFRAKMLGANDFLTKPIDPQAVFKMLFYHLPVKQ